MLFNMDVSHMAISAPGVSELLEQTVCFWLTAHFSLLITTMYFLEKNTSETILGKTGKTEKVNTGYTPTQCFFYVPAFGDADIWGIACKNNATATQLTCLDKALKAHTLVLPVEGSTSRKGNMLHQLLKRKKDWASWIICHNFLLSKNTDKKRQPAWMEGQLESSVN